MKDCRVTHQVSDWVNRRKNKLAGNSNSILQRNYSKYVQGDHGGQGLGFVDFTMVVLLSVQFCFGW